MTAVFVGLATIDLVQRVERVPGPDEKVGSLDAELLAGVRPPSRRSPLRSSYRTRCW